ncbi:hypothetical protein [Neobacillus sp. 19]
MTQASNSSEQSVLSFIRAMMDFSQEIPAQIVLHKGDDGLFRGIPLE